MGERVGQLAVHMCETNFNQGKKWLICLFALSNSGKTSTIRRVLQKLGGVLQQTGDFVDKVNYKGYIVGAASVGDPDSSQAEDIESLMLDRCDIIVCAARSRGQTKTDVENLSAQYGYYAIFNSPYYTETWMRDTNYRLLYEANSDIVISLINQIINNQMP